MFLPFASTLFAFLPPLPFIPFASRFFFRPFLFRSLLSLSLHRPVHAFPFSFSRSSFSFSVPFHLALSLLFSVFSPSPSSFIPLALLFSFVSLSDFPSLLLCLSIYLSVYLVLFLSLCPVTLVSLSLSALVHRVHELVHPPGFSRRPRVIGIEDERLITQSIVNYDGKESQVLISSLLCPRWSRLRAWVALEVRFRGIRRHFRRNILASKWSRRKPDLTQFVITVKFHA